MRPEELEYIRPRDYAAMRGVHYRTIINHFNKGALDGFGTSDVAYLILPNKSRVVCASKVFGWFLVATRTEGFTVSQPITQESARRILAAVLSEEEVSRIWP